MNWKLIEESQPPLNKIVATKIEDWNGIRNEEYLFFDGSVWWHADGKMYVYYQPTHWKLI